MAKTAKVKRTLPYLQRLVQDEYVQDQLREAAVGLRKAYGRAASKRTQAPDDKKLYGSLRRAATSIRNATVALRRPEPPPKRRGRKLLIITVAAGAAAMLTRLGQPDESSVVSSS
jgi:hypothetical protein